MNQSTQSCQCCCHWDKSLPHQDDIHQEECEHCKSPTLRYSFISSNGTSQEDEKYRDIYESPSPQVSEVCNKCWLEGNKGVCDNKSCINHQVSNWEKELTDMMPEGILFSKIRFLVRETIATERQRLLESFEQIIESVSNTEFPYSELSEQLEDLKSSQENQE